jgi:hypothetical protein
MQFYTCSSIRSQGVELSVQTHKSSVRPQDISRQQETRLRNMYFPMEYIPSALYTRTVKLLNERALT